ncbi:MAG: efflux RND transporter periplasmic adaptor subunit [Candidatus Omnitrophica bacterium]|nr:efflux RND transporter periplasmic adaptor subunit [Candidatus Omnitrophota bacterium]
MKRYNLLLMIFIAIFILPGCMEREREEIYEQAAHPVSVTRISRQDLKEFLFYSGDIEAEDEATVYSRVTGKLAENKVQEGNAVKKGETLALVDRDEIGYEFELAPVASPIQGVVGRAYLDKGANVTLTTPVVLVVNMDEVRVKIDVTEKDLPKVVEGLIAQVKVDAYPDETFQGRLQKVSPVVDLNTRTAPAWISIVNSQHKLKPGMFARLRLMAGEHKNVPVIIREAAIEEDSQRYVFVVENNRAYKRKVELGLASEGKYEVLTGLRPGEKVIVMGPSDLKNGDPVKVVEEVK